MSILRAHRRTHKNTTLFGWSASLLGWLSHLPPARASESGGFFSPPDLAGLPGRPDLSAELWSKDAAFTSLNRVVGVLFTPGSSACVEATPQAGFLMNTPRRVAHHATSRATATA